MLVRVALYSMSFRMDFVISIYLLWAELKKKMYFYFLLLIILNDLFYMPELIDVYLEKQKQTWLPN